MGFVAVMKQELNKYSVFGLTLDSQIDIPELSLGDGVADASIGMGTVPFYEDNGVTYRISKTEFAFKIDELAKFLVKNGDQIVIEPKGKPDLQTLRVYLLGTAVGILLIQKDIVPIHGSAVIIDDKAVILTGDCGSGKTTLSSWFLKSGYGYLSDDISAVRFDKYGMPVVYPSFAQQRLNHDTVMHLGLNADTLSKACSHDEKFVVKPKDTFVSQPKPLTCIIQLIQGNTENVVLEKITGIEKIHNIIYNVYCSVLYKEVGFTKSFFSLCMKIAEKVHMYRLIRPKGLFTADQQMKLVLETLM